MEALGRLAGPPPCSGQPCLGLVVPHTRLLMPSPSPSEPNSTRLVEGCFCPEGTTSYAPGFDVCVDLCGRLPAARPLPSPSRG